MAAVARRKLPWRSILQQIHLWLGVVFCQLALERLDGSIQPVSPYVGDDGLAFEITLPAR